MTPFAAFALGAVAGVWADHAGAIKALGAYGAVILSFMGGVQWGVAMSRTRGGERVGARAFGISTLPALIAWACLVVAPRTGLIGVAAGLGLLLAYDVWTTRNREAPPWYGAFRAPLTAAAIACLLTPVVAGRLF